MGVHWHARSREFLDSRKALEQAERALAAAATPGVIETCLAERDRLFEQVMQAADETEHRGLAVTLADAARWPRHVAAHLDQLPAADPSTPLLDLLGWRTDYYAENLKRAGIGEQNLARSIGTLDAEPGDAVHLGEELLALAEKAPGERRRHTASAGLWLYLWGRAGCWIEASD